MNMEWKNNICQFQSNSPNCPSPPSLPPSHAHAHNLVQTAGVCPPKGQGWVIDSGKDAGALGDGWYKDKLNSMPYTIATATTGSCGFVEYDAVRTAAGKAKDPALASIAIGAVNWLVQSRSADGGYMETTRQLFISRRRQYKVYMERISDYICLIIIILSRTYAFMLFVLLFYDFILYYVIL